MTDRQKQSLIQVSQVHLARVAAAMRKNLPPTDVSGLLLDAALDVLAVSMPRDAGARALIARLAVAAEGEADRK